MLLGGNLNFLLNALLKFAPIHFNRKAAKVEIAMNANRHSNYWDSFASFAKILAPLRLSHFQKFFFINKLKYILIKFKV